MIITLNELNDKSSYKSLNESDEQTFKELFYSYYDSLYMFCYRRTQSADLSADIIQDVFVRVWQNRSKLDQNRSIKAYLFQITQNIIIDYFRKKTTQEAYQQMESSENAVSHIDESFEVEENIRDALQKLPDDLRTVFLMNRFDGLKYSEIAESLEISVKTVESRMTKALKMLRQLLEHLLVIMVFLSSMKDYLIYFFENR